MKNKFSLPTELPNCLCGANDYTLGYWPPPDDLLLARCEVCKEVFRPSIIMIDMIPAAEPVAA